MDQLTMMTQAQKHVAEVLKDFDWLMHGSGNPLTDEEIVCMYESDPGRCWYMAGYYNAIRAQRGD